MKTCAVVCIVLITKDRLLHQYYATAVGCQQQQFPKRSKKRQTRMMFERYDFFYIIVRGLEAT